MATKTINMLNNDFGTVNINMNSNHDKPLRNIRFNCLNAVSCFKGRSDDLKQILEHFASKQVVVIHGAPGIGKTETARCFSIRNSDNFDGNLVWINSETPENLEKCFECLSKTLDLKICDASQVYSKFRFSKCLFIFDNVGDMSSIKKYLPISQFHPTVHVLITTQLSKWNSNIAKVHLEALNLDAALEIFQDKLGDKYREYPTKTWKDLVEYLEGIPLSLQMASALINDEFCKVRITKFNLENFIISLKLNFIYSDIPKCEMINYNKSVFNSICFALERLKEEDTSDSLDLLLFMAYLDAENIYHPILLSIPFINKSEEKLEAALNQLVQYSLIQVEQIENIMSWQFMVGEKKMSSVKKLEKLVSFNKTWFKIKIHRTIQLISRKYDLNERNASMFNIVLETIIKAPCYYYEDYFDFNHENFVFKYVKEEEYKDTSLEFYIRNKPLVNLYLNNLAAYHCFTILKELLPKFKEDYLRNDKFKKTLDEMLFSALINRNNSLLTINLLVKYGAKLDSSPNMNGFCFASFWLSVELFDLLLESNDPEIIINSKDEKGQTILHLLVKYCHEDNFESTIKCLHHLIFKWKADISIRDEWDYTILHIVCRNWELRFEFFMFLVEKCNCKVLVNTQCFSGKTPLQLLFKNTFCDLFTAKEKYNRNLDLFKMVSYFIKECEADLTIQDKSNWNTLFYVCRYGTLEIINFVLKTIKCRDFINVQDQMGDVAFTQLIYNKLIQEQDKIMLMKLFIENNMDFYTKNKYNKTLPIIAEEENFMELSEELKKPLVKKGNYNNYRNEKKKKYYYICN